MMIKVLILLVIVNVACADRKNQWWNVDDAHKQGPHVCAVEVSEDINYSYYTDAKFWNPRKICGRQTFIRYECCAGYYKVAGHPGCTGVKPLIDLIETTRRVGSAKFAKLIERSSFAEELRVGSPVTLFVPSDAAFDNYLKIKGIRPEWLHDGNRYLNLIANHIVDRRVLSAHWQENVLIPSRLEGNVLRINKFSNGMETVNCHRVVRKDQIATNGIVHVIDGVLDLALAHNSEIIDLAAKDGRFDIFIKALEASELRNKVKLNDVPYTIFAPTDEAFRNIPEAHLNAVFADPEALNALIAHHIVPHPICAPNIISEHHEKTLQHGKLTLNCSSHGPTVDHVALKNEMYHGRNGLLYVLDHVLLPNRAKSVLELAEDEGLFTFLEIVRAAELEGTLSRLKHYTIFAPSETAMHSLSRRQLAELQENRESAREFVLHHVVTGRYLTDEIRRNLVVRTLDEEIPLHFQVYWDQFGIENAMILRADREATNGVLHVISHILHPTEVSLEYVLKTDGNFNIWLDAMERIKTTDSQLYHEFKHCNSSCTYFVPSDDAFRRLGNVKLRNLLENNNYLAKTVRNHVIDHMIISESFNSELQYTVRTKENTVNVVRNDNKIQVNDATLVKYDILTKGGIIHEINGVLLPNQCSRGYKKMRDGTVRRTCA